MPFVQKLPEWNKPGTEPPASLKNAGWAATQKPPADYFNWLQYTAYMALKELQEKAQHKDDATAIPDASITQKGITQLSSAVTSAAEDRAATPNAVKKVNDSLNTHKEDNAKQIKVKRNLTLLPANWALNNATQLYEYRINDADISETTVVDINIRVADLDKAMNVLSANDSFNGYVKMYAKNPPTANIICDMKLIRRVF